MKPPSTCPWGRRAEERSGRSPCCLGYYVGDERVAAVTIVYEQGEDGWIVASILDVPGANSQGRTRDEARANVIDALRGVLELRLG